MSNTGPPLLVVQHLTLAFANVIAIDDLSFTARDRQITAIVGPPGAGKTSVLNCISGLCRPSVGRIEFLCRPGTPMLLERMETSRINRDARIVRTFRNPRIFARLTVLENVLVAQNAARSRRTHLSTLFASSTSRKASERAHYWLDRMGLTHALGRTAGALSSGLQRRVEIARALAATPRFLCMDEPAAGLDEWEQDDLIRRLQDCKAEIPAILVTGSDFKVPDALCDHLVIVDRGACIASGNGPDLSGHAPVLRAWLGVPAGGETMPRIPVSC
jgi:branched-chain amino acid transport system ATP-binding protein